MDLRCKKAYVLLFLFTLGFQNSSFALSNEPITPTTQITDVVSNQALAPTTFNPRTEAVYIQINKVSKVIISIVQSLDIFKLDPIIDTTDTAATGAESMSLLNFELHNLKSTTVPAYVRKKHFGTWAKNKKSGTCYNTRAKVLIRDNVGVIKFRDENPCSVESGLWNDPYSEEQMTNAQEEIQIDHMVPLKDAYISGAYKWTFRERCLYGNYLGYTNHLLSVYGEENNQKSDQTPEDYMPPKTQYHCQYLKDWLTIKAIWGLNMEPEEAANIKKQIEDNSCDKTAFRITRKELNDQFEFFKANENICQGL